MGLRAKIFAVLALATLLPALLVGALAVRRARRDVRREVVRGNLALVRATGAALDATLQDLRQALSLAAGVLADTPPEQFKDPPTQRLLARVKRELPAIRRLALLNAGGYRIAGDPIELPAFERANTYGGYVSDVIRAPGEPPRALVIVQARDRTAALRGFLAAEIDLGFVGDTIAVARLSRGTRLWVIDGAGEPVGTGGPVAAGTAPPRRAVEQALASGAEGSVEESGTLAVYANLASFQTVRGVSWAIVLAQPTREAYALAAATTRDTVLVGALVLAAVLLVGAWVATRITRLEEAARAAAERERLRAALARGEQLATVGALAAGVAHEINNPLTTILGYANLMLEDKQADHPDRERLSLVADEARRVQGIVRTLLDHARVETAPPRREAVDVNALVERTVALVGPTLKKRRLEVKVAVGEALPRPTGDPLRLEQVLVNLAQNAAQAMEPGGELAIRTAALGDGRVEIAVADTGPGIPQDLLGRIFDPFFTTKGPGVGTGLGLAIAQRIVLDHGGRIEVESELGRGSTFRVIL